MDTDKILYDKFLQGDNESLAELISIHKESLTLFLFSYIKDMHEAENMMIDVFAQLVVSGGKFKGNSSLKTYLFTIGRNEALRYIKKNKQHLTLDEIQHQAFSSKDFVELNLLAEERKRHLYMGMEQLQPDYRDVLFLLYFEDMSYKEAGLVMKKNERQITNLTYRAKKALKEILEKEGFVYDGE